MAPVRTLPIPASLVSGAALQDRIQHKALRSHVLTPASPVDNDLEPMGSYQTTADESHRDDRPADVREYAGEMAAFHGC